MDRRIPYHDLRMHCGALDVAEPALPSGYAFRLYVPGDERHWARIETSAGEFDREQQCAPAFERSFGAGRAELPHRMLFLLNPQGVPIGTATAWRDEGMGRLHWVAIDSGHQGRGLAKPLVARAMRTLHQLGHREAFLTTQTPSWIAIKVYSQLGWVPSDTGAEDFAQAWALVREKLGR